MGSDHVVGWEPSSYEEMYNPNIWSCRTGFSRVEMMMPALLSEGVNKGRLSIERVVQVACENPAKTAGIWGRKGSLLPGFDADMVLVDLSREVKVNKGPHQHAVRLVADGRPHLQGLAGEDDLARKGHGGMGEG